MKINNILISGAGGSVLTSIIPQLPEYEKLYLMDADEDIAIRHFCDDKKNIFIKCPLGTDPNFKNFIKNIIIKNKIDYCIPLVDEELISFSELYHEGLFNYLCGAKNLSFINLCLNKETLIKSLAMNAFDVPGYFYPIEILYQDPGFKFVVAKPNSGHGSKGVYVLTKLELTKYIHAGIINEDKYCFQEYIDGAEYTISVLKDVVIPKRIIKKRGITMAAITERNQLIEDVCRSLYYHYKPNGPINVQGIFTKDGQFKIFEINPRLSTTTILTFMSGVNEVFAGFGFKYNKNFEEGFSMYRYYDQIFEKNNVLIENTVIL